MTGARGGLCPLQFLPPFLNFPNAVESGRTDDDDFAYTVRLAYDVNPDLNVYASYATGFKANPYADVKPAGDGSGTSGGRPTPAAPRKLWHTSPGSAGR